ncbi:MAG: aerotolerance regulator BatC, partial [Marinilabiliaceae bacterium]|nr:aerotolerance regulator BatC [Marinilabiliaceae bacterium]
QDQQNNKDQEQENQPENSEEDNKQEQENTDQQEMSKEDAERLLQALAADEQQVQEKVKEAKAAKARVKVLKNW